MFCKVTQPYAYTVYLLHTLQLVCHTHAPYKSHDYPKRSNFSQELNLAILEFFNSKMCQNWKSKLSNILSIYFILFIIQGVKTQKKITHQYFPTPFCSFYPLKNHNKSHLKAVLSQYTQYQIRVPAPSPALTGVSPSLKIKFNPIFWLKKCRNFHQNVFQMLIL